MNTLYTIIHCNESITFILTEWKRSVSLHFYNGQSWVGIIRPYLHKIHVYIAYWVTVRDVYIITSPGNGWRVCHYFIQHAAICHCIHGRYARIAYTHYISRSWNRNHTRKKYIQASQILSNTKCVYLNSWGRDKMAAIFQKPFHMPFSWMNIYIVKI